MLRTGRLEEAAIAGMLLLLATPEEEKDADVGSCSRWFTMAAVGCTKAAAPG